MKMNGDASLPGWFYCLMALIFLLMFSEHIATAWEWVRSNSEAQAVMRRPDLTDLRERAEQDDANALSVLGEATSTVWVVCHRVIP